jgi:hypothetical protein
MKNSLDSKCGPFEYRWSIDPAGYRQLEVYRDAPGNAWEEAQAEIDKFMLIARTCTLPLCTYLFPLDDKHWHNISEEAVVVLRALLASSNETPQDWGV